MQRVAFELKIQRKTLPPLLKEGLAQISTYADLCKADEAHLIIFDRSGKSSWNKRIWEKIEKVDGRIVQVWGM